jgi:polyisoprenoid-binding protein YceI
MDTKRCRALYVLIAALFICSLSFWGQSKADTYQVDPVHSSVEFKVRHMVSKVSGRFTDFSGIVVGDPAKPGSASVTFAIKTASIDTKIPDRDKHLKSPDFFDAEKFPEITFKSTKITPKGGDKYEVAGTFTMHGVTKEVVIPVAFGGVAKDPWGKDRAGFSLQLTLNRKDYGINWNKLLDQGGTLVGDDVEVSIDLEAVRQVETKSEK